jgi:hypothetical protein
MKYIYTITTIKNPMVGSYLGSRCVGWFPTFKQAEEAVVENQQDIYELGHYPYCVIEKVGFGIYFLDREEYWYRWSKDSSEYSRIPMKPTIFDHMACFGIG